MDRAIDASVKRGRLVRRSAAGGSLLVVGWALLVVVPGWLRPSVRQDRIRTARVERGRIEATLQASGTLVPTFERVLSSPVDARVVAVLKQPGAAVRKGEEILELDTSATRLEIERLRERLDQKENDREQLRLGLAQTQADLKSRAESKELDLEILRYRVEQQRKLHTDGLISEEVLRSTEVEVKKAEIEVKQISGSVESAGRFTEAKLAGLALEIRILTKELDEARRQLELATPRSDRDGVLTWVVQEEGAMVRRGDVVVKIADLDSFRVEATISDVHSSRLVPGMAVKVVQDERILPGRLASVHPTIDNGVVRFLVDLEDGSDPALRNNLRVDVLVVTDSRDEALRVEKGPFARGGAVEQVFVVRGDRAYRTEVRFGVSGYRCFEVLEGLGAGDEVIVSDMQDYLHLSEIWIKGKGDRSNFANSRN